MLHRPPGQLPLMILFGLLLGLPSLYPLLFPLAWFAFVPLALESAGPGRSYLLGLSMGPVVWLLSSYGVVEFVTLSRGWAQPWSTLAALLFWLYAAQLFALIAVLSRWLRYHAPVPLLLWFPLLVVSVVALFPMLINARLGEWQVAFPVALQGADITGAHGIDLMMALSSAPAYQLLQRQWSGVQRCAMPMAAALLVGWFGRTHQPFQHLRTSSLRAVENRMPMIHAIDNGPSAVIAPSGRVVYKTEPFSRSETVVHIPHDPSSGGSFYSRHPRLFPYTVYALPALILAATLICWFRPRT